MTLQATQERETIGSSQPYVSLRNADLLERFDELIHACVSTSQPRVLRHDAGTREEILFEADVDDAHYYLIRVKPQVDQRLSLSPRELAIAHLIAKGLPNKSIGDLLDISPWTVATHLRRIFLKLGVTSRAAMVARLIDERLL